MSFWPLPKLHFNTHGGQIKETRSCRFHQLKNVLVFPECNAHDKTLCEVYCNDCHDPICELCVTTTHKKHDIADIKSIIENLKKRITADVKELKNCILSKYKQNVIGNIGKEFDKLMNAMQDQEETICKVYLLPGSTCSL